MTFVVVDDGGQMRKKLLIRWKERRSIHTPLQEKNTAPQNTRHVPESNIMHPVDLCRYAGI